MISALRIALVGDFNRQQKAHQAIPQVLRAVSNDIECVWVSSESAATGDSLSEFHGIWVVPGMPYRNADGVLRAIRHARLSRTPFVGTSAGFQYALIEYARDVAGLSGADHQKTAPNASIPLVTPLELALAGVHSRVHFTAGSRLRAAYGTSESTEEYHCSFGLNDRYRRLLEGRDLYV